MSTASSVVQLFRNRLVAREDCYALQCADGSYAMFHAPLTDRIILSHLRGHETLGLFPYADGTTKWICIDIDTLEPTCTQRVQQELSRQNIPCLTEFSGLKGFHIWMFLTQPIPNQKARQFARLLAPEHEVFPKQDQIPEGGYGNLIKPPLGKHQVSGRWCLFVNDDLNPLDHPYEVLAETPLLDSSRIESLVGSASMEPNKGPHMSSHSDEPGRAAFVRPPVVKDCVQMALRDGSMKGLRNKTALVLAIELRNAGIGLEEALHLLQSVWNARNTPPLSLAEVERVVRSAFRNTAYQCSCRQDGMLRQTIPCIGSKQCVYYTLLKTNHNPKETS